MDITAGLKPIINAVELLRRGINETPQCELLIDGAKLAKVGKLANPICASRQGYKVFAYYLENGEIHLQIADSMSLTESGKVVTSLQALGISTFLKFGRSVRRGTVYRKNGVLRYALIRKSGRPWGTIPLEPMTERERIRACMAPKADPAPLSE